MISVLTEVTLTSRPAYPSSASWRENNYVFKIIKLDVVKLSIIINFYLVKLGVEHSVSHELSLFTDVKGRHYDYISAFLVSSSKITASLFGLERLLCGWAFHTPQKNLFETHSNWKTATMLAVHNT